MGEVKLNLERLESNTLRGLKDFQRATVERVDALFAGGKRRVLVSDEVGLGKTLVAKGVIAKMVRRYGASSGNLFKVVYICSNAAIAGQNLNKLRLDNSQNVERTGYSRLSMQHLQIYRKMGIAKSPEKKGKQAPPQFLQLIPLTPDTSFRMTRGTGSVEERALMFAILRRIPELTAYRAPLETAMKDWAEKAWGAWACAGLEAEVVACDASCHGEYLMHMLRETRERLATPQDNGSSYLDELIDLCDRVTAAGNKRVSDSIIINKLRLMFAQIGVDLLEPELVIMDEFQRFKYLIDAEADPETSLLAKRFFSGKNARVLLLSATPYKLYSTAEEISESHVDEHYVEFLKVMEFLLPDSGEFDQFREIWGGYSVRLKEMSDEDTAILAVKNKAEDTLYHNICRTERISARQSADIIDDSSVKTPLEITEDDIRAYIQAQELLSKMEVGYKVPVDYVKSTPYLLSFMRDYKMKEHITSYFKKHPDEVSAANKDSLWIKRSQVERYGRIAPRNARLAQLEKLVFSQNAERLLWVPPSKPYYALQGPYKGSEGFTKTLVFSAWEMVPRMISSLVSYEAERKNIEVLVGRNKAEQREAKYFSADTKNSKRYPLPKLNFALSRNEPKAMSLFCLIYPSFFLESCYNPVDALNRGLTLSGIKREVTHKIKQALGQLEQKAKTFGRVDDRWYYLAPLWLDDTVDPNHAQMWLDDVSNERYLNNQAFDEEDAETSGKRGRKGFNTHIAWLKRIYQDETLKMGKMPSDLLDVLTSMALASPAVCALRAHLDLFESTKYTYPTELAKALINRLNTPESTAVIEACYGKSSEDAHWKNVLRYCVDGNFQAVVDEYIHMLKESNSLGNDIEDADALQDIMMSSMRIRTTIYTADTHQSFERFVKRESAHPVNFRSHFAVAFTKGEHQTAQETDRKRIVRDAFNSPFRPFVLASTSIGQEGLDFHYYCRRIVHWNLPANPIDLEQREGRINRFKCLAIRQNIVRRYGGLRFERNIWEEMFAEAERRESSVESSELLPFWGTLADSDLVKIERIVPLYPLSRDVAAYERLIKILSLYRLTLGQARQAELLEHIFSNQSSVKSENVLNRLFINLSPYFKELMKTSL